MNFPFLLFSWSSNLWILEFTTLYMKLNLEVIYLIIFSTIYQSMIVSPEVLIWFTNVINFENWSLLFWLSSIWTNLYFMLKIEASFASHFLRHNYIFLKYLMSLLILTTLKCFQKDEYPHFVEHRARLYHHSSSNLWMCLFMHQIVLLSNFHNHFPISNTSWTSNNNVIKTATSSFWITFIKNQNIKR